MPHSADLLFVIDLAHRAAAVALEHYRHVERLTKRGAEAVTAADRASQRLIVAGLRARFPDDGIIGEENDDGSAITNSGPARGQRVWVIDPIDGTNNYVAGFGAWAICIGLLDAGMPIMGVICDPSQQLLYAAERGGGAWVNERAVRAASSGLSDCSLLMLTSNLLNTRGELPGVMARWLTLSPWKLRMLGSAALEAVQVGAGTAHGALTLNGKLWDLVAAAAIVVEAGGVITDLDGRAVFPIDLAGYVGGKVPFLAAGPGAHAQLLDEFRRFSADWLR